MAPAAAVPSERLPTVEVFDSSDGNVVIKWGEGVAKQVTVKASNSDTVLYCQPPYQFHALDSDGAEPFIKTFGSLFGCDGGTLTIGDTHYRIQVKEQDRQDGKRQLEEIIDDRIAAKQRVQRAKRPTRTLSYTS